MFRDNSLDQVTSELLRVNADFGARLKMEDPFLNMNFKRVHKKVLDAFALLHLM